MTAVSAIVTSQNHQPLRDMHLIAIGWIYVVLLMALAEAVSAQGTLLGALITFVLYGVLPLGLVLYIEATPARKRARRAAESYLQKLSAPPDGSSHAAGDAAAAEREKA